MKFYKHVVKSAEPLAGMLERQRDPSFFGADGRKKLYRARKSARETRKEETAGGSLLVVSPRLNSAPRRASFS
jgi:hypothetical protein